MLSSSSGTVLLLVEIAPLSQCWLKLLGLPTKSPRVPGILLLSRMPSPYRMSKFSVLCLVHRASLFCLFPHQLHCWVSGLCHLTPMHYITPIELQLPLVNFLLLWAILLFFLNRLYCVFDSFRFTENLSRKYRDSCVSPDTICAHPPPSPTSPTREGRLLQLMNLHRCPVTTQNL